MNEKEEAANLVRSLSVEDLSGCLTNYESRLVDLGFYSVNPLNEFLATEGQPRTSELGPCSENYEAARRVLKQIQGVIKMSDIALVIVDAVAPDISENPAIAKDAIQELTDAKVAGRSYEFFSEYANIKGTDGTEKINGDYTLDHPHIELILVGGSLGNKHYDAFKSQVSGTAASLTIHMPLDCTYAFENDKMDGEAFTRAVQASPDQPIFQKYKAAMRRFGPSAYMIERNGEVQEKSPITQVKLWDNWQMMANYLAQPGK